MTEDKSERVSSENRNSSDASHARQRKKRKWDQPAESVGAVPGILPLGSIAGVPLPGIASFSSALLMNHYAASSATVPMMPLPQNATVGVSKPNPLKIQEDLIIAREIVINDADPSVRYKLTKRQTQEEIQKLTSAVVITRGKYRPPNAPPGGEKPLYLHISAAAHLKDTTERILAVDRAAAMVDEMLKQGQGLQSTSVFSTTTGNGELSTCVFLGFDADPSLNIVARIRGPNDQYINHIMNETGATVILRGHVSGNLNIPNSGETHQPLHLFLSANNLKSLDDAKLLAENLLDTISLECGASRVSSSKLYKAVPPPQLLGGVQSLGNGHQVNPGSASGLSFSAMSSIPSMPASSVSVPGVSTVLPQGTVPQSGVMVNSMQLQSNLAGYSQSLVTRGTSYNGYGDIYPQATPLQQVALALRQSSSPISSTVAPTTLTESSAAKLSTSSISERGKLAKQKRKFQELPAGAMNPAKSIQGSELSKPGGQLEPFTRNICTIPAPRKAVQPSNAMPPPPPKFTSPIPAEKAHDKKNPVNRMESDSVPETLVKLMEYGEDDDDTDEASEGQPLNDSHIAPAAPKPFWAL